MQRGLGRVLVNIAGGLIRSLCQSSRRFGLAWAAMWVNHKAPEHLSRLCLETEKQMREESAPSRYLLPPALCCWAPRNEHPHPKPSMPLSLYRGALLIRNNPPVGP